MKFSDLYLTSAAPKMHIFTILFLVSWMLY